VPPDGLVTQSPPKELELQPVAVAQGTFKSPDGQLDEAASTGFVGSGQVHQLTDGERVVAESPDAIAATLAAAAA
jgi:hypothetical protein